MRFRPHPGLLPGWPCRTKSPRQQFAFEGDLPRPARVATAQFLNSL
jgi:hypothetical protein